MNDHVCPWWLAYTFDNPARRLLHNPEKILGEFIGTGQTVIDLGCGMGYFSIAMARLVGERGRVISVDIQEKMLETVSRRAERQGLQSRIQLHQSEPYKIGVNEQVDFALAFWMVHEVPNIEAFLKELLIILKPEARFLLVEPKIHVTASDFQKTVELACAAGLKLCSEPNVRMSRAVLFAKGQSDSPLGDANAPDN
jgi:ubiquinone/menaquinone biosynthesis C-methylase UbiE